MFSLGFLFLAISPKLRNQVIDAIGAGVMTLDRYSPYSTSRAALILVTLLASFYRGAQAR
jgi:hypothetical protein